MALDGLFTQAKLFGDIPVAAAFHDAPHHFKFTGSESIGLWWRRRCLLHQVMQSRNKINNPLATDPIVARTDGADGSLQMADQCVFQHNAPGANMKGLD